MKFELDEEQVKKLSEWWKDHKKCPRATLGECSVYKFIPTGLGMIAVVECSCGEEINLTDFEHW